MMDDFFARNRLSAYLDGELPTSEAREVEAALARSPELKAEYERLREAVGLLRREGPLQAPPRLAEAIRERVARERMPGRLSRWIPPIRLETLALAAVALFALSYIAMPDRPPEPAAVAEAPAAATPEEVAAAPPIEAPAPSVANNGVLGDESRTTSSAGRQSMAQAPTPTTTKKAAAPKLIPVEKEPFQTEWEAQTNLEELKSKPLAYSPPPYRFQVRTRSDAALSTLAGLAAELGGRLVDNSGRPIAPYPMEVGDTRAVKIVVPQYNVDALHARLRALGEVEVMEKGSEKMYAAGADVDVAVEVTVE